MEDGATSGTQLSLREFFCRALFECPTADDDQIYLTLTLGSAERCMNVLFEGDDAYLAQLRPLLDNLVAAETPLCGDLDLLRAGTGMTGASCRIHDACAPGYYCDTREQCPGACARQLAADDDCVDDAQCESGSCNHLDGTCAPVVSLRIVGEGETCVVRDDNDEVVEWRGCEAGTYCEPWDTSTCRRPPGQGESCMDFDQPCARGSVCQDEVGKCVPASVADVGEPCGYFEDRVAVCDEFEGEFCNETTEVCERPMQGGEGDPCLAGDAHDSCGPGLWCDLDSGKCAQLLPAGAECGDSPCAFGCDYSVTPAVCRDAYCDVVSDR